VHDGGPPANRALARKGNRTQRLSDLFHPPGLF
jgi:hypothetical protein